jgi:hypothetical protein
MNIDGLRPHELRDRVIADHTHQLRVAGYHTVNLGRKNGALITEPTQSFPSRGP